MAFTTTNAVHQRQQTAIGMANTNDIESKIFESADVVSSDSSFGNVFDRRKIILGVGGLLSSSLVQNSNNDNNFSFRAVAAEAPTKEFPTFVLPNKVNMPVLALNTVGLSVDETARACEIVSRRHASNER